MKIIDYLLVSALLTTALAGLYSVLLRWLRTPLRAARIAAGQHKQSLAEESRSTHAAASRQSAANHAFSR